MASTRVSTRVSTRRARQSKQSKTPQATGPTIVSSTNAAQPELPDGITPEQVEESLRKIRAVNLDEVTDERIPFTFWHYTVVEVKDEETNEIYQERVRVPRRVRLIKDVPSELFLDFAALQQQMPNIRNLDKGALRAIKEGVHAVCCFTLPDLPFEDIDAIPLDHLIALVERFFL